MSLSQAQCSLFSLSSDPIPRDLWSWDIATESYKCLTSAFTEFHGSLNVHATSAGASAAQTAYHLRACEGGSPGLGFRHWGPQQVWNCKGLELEG